MPCHVAAKGQGLTSAVHQTMFGGRVGEGKVRCPKQLNKPLITVNPLEAAGSPLSPCHARHRADHALHL